MASADTREYKGGGGTDDGGGGRGRGEPAVRAYRMDAPCAGGRWRQTRNRPRENKTEAGNPPSGTSCGERAGRWEHTRRDTRAAGGSTDSRCVRWGQWAAAGVAAPAWRQRRWRYRRGAAAVPRLPRRTAGGRPPRGGGGQPRTLHRPLHAHTPSAVEGAGGGRWGQPPPSRPPPPPPARPPGGRRDGGRVSRPRQATARARGTATLPRGVPAAYHCRPPTPPAGASAAAPGPHFTPPPRHGIVLGLFFLVLSAPPRAARPSPSPHSADSTPHPPAPLPRHRRPPPSPPRVALADRRGLRRRPLPPRRPPLPLSLSSSDRRPRPPPAGRPGLPLRRRRRRARPLAPPSGRPPAARPPGLSLRPRCRS